MARAIGKPNLWMACASVSGARTLQPPRRWRGADACPTPARPSAQRHAHPSARAHRCCFDLPGGIVQRGAAATLHRHIGPRRAGIGLTANGGQNRAHTRHHGGLAGGPRQIKIGVMEVRGADLLRGSGQRRRERERERGEDNRFPNLVSPCARPDAVSFRYAAPACRARAVRSCNCVVRLMQLGITNRR